MTQSSRLSWAALTAVAEGSFSSELDDLRFAELSRSLGSDGAAVRMLHKARRTLSGRLEDLQGGAKASL